MNSLARFRIPLLVGLALSVVVVTATLPELIGARLPAKRLAASDLESGKASGKITIRGRFQYGSIAKEYQEKDGSELAGSDYYLAFVPEGSKRVLYVKTGSEPVYSLLRYGTDEAEITGIARSLSESKFAIIAGIVPPAISSGGLIADFPKPFPGETLTRESMFAAEAYLSLLAQAPMDKAEAVAGFFLDLNYESGMFGNILLFAFFGALGLVCAILAIIGFRSRTTGA